MIKKILKISLVIAFFGSTVFAQRNCGTMDYLEQQLQSDPALQQRMNEIEEHTNGFVLEEDNRVGASVTIPIVFHVLYNNSAQNISDARILAQLDVLNKDFRKLNSDIGNVPAAFSGLAADASIEFCLATVDPNGNPTTGIVRKSTTVTSFSSNDAMKYSAQGGNNAWNSSKYLNIWVCNLGSGLLGYAQFPGGATATDGVVVLFGTVGSSTVPGTSTPYHLGRTLTHEVGHWLNLRHIWGDANCGNDQVTDTPTQQTSNYGCPSFPKVTCSNGPNGDMFMNYMDYVDDACMYMLTTGQKARMQALFSTGGARASLLTSGGCGAVTPSCGTPSSLSTSNITNTGATLSWAAVSGATSYNIRYKLTSSTTWVTTTSTTTSKAIIGLTLGSVYEFQVQAVCSVTGTYSSSVNFTTTGGSGGGSTNSIVIGTGTSTTGNMPYGTYYMDQRSQIIITRAELIAAGYTSANSIIKNLAFFTGTASTQTMTSFTIKISHTTASSFSSTSFLAGSGTVTVFSGNVAALSNQWNTHTFSTPFTYNGVNNLLIDICFNNSSFTSDTPVRFTTTSSNTALYRRQDVASGGICTTTTGTRSTARPNVRFTFGNTARFAQELTEEVKPVFEVYPNPATSFLNVKFAVSDDNAPVKISIMNITGQVVANISKGTMQQGEYLETIELNNDAAIQMPAGIYICTIQQGEQMQYKKFVLNK
jgi:hypothetical protein